MTSAYNGPSAARLQALLARAACLLLDFDGPVCRLFQGYPSGDIAADLRAYLAERGSPVKDPGLITGTNPHEILRATTNGELAAGLELLLAEAEEVAAHSAEPTPLAARFIRTAAGSGRVLAITTNNAPAAVAVYLKEHGLEGFFGQRIFGRSTRDPALMKPHPDCLLRAIETLGVRPGDCLMIGDSAADAAAAKAAHVPFLGYARSADRVARLRTVDPHPVVIGMPGLVAAIEGAARPTA
ncbi:HAD family hydrolase [Streptomyces polygonati]|uniref:HAD family hydrolase n=1 Tax=Streptomyces polygonati TaxID=1617087 RepID=A0ABV8HDR1_9ACTN